MNGESATEMGKTKWHQEIAMRRSDQLRKPVLSCEAMLRFGGDERG